MKTIELYSDQILEEIKLDKSLKDFDKKNGDYLKVELFDDNNTILNTLYSNRILLRYPGPGARNRLKGNTYYFGDYHFEEDTNKFMQGRDRVEEGKPKLELIPTPVNFDSSPPDVPSELYRKQIEIYEDKNHEIYIKPNEIISLVGLGKGKFILKVHFLRNVISNISRLLGMLKNNFIENGNFFAGLEATQTGDLDRSSGLNNFIEIPNPGLGKFVLEQDGFAGNHYDMRITGIKPHRKYIASCWVAWDDDYDGYDGSFHIFQLARNNNVIKSTDIGVPGWIADKNSRIVIGDLIWERRYLQFSVGECKDGIIYWRVGFQSDGDGDASKDRTSKDRDGRRYFTDLRFELSSRSSVVGRKWWGWNLFGDKFDFKKIRKGAKRRKKVFPEIRTRTPVIFGLPRTPTSRMSKWQKYKERYLARLRSIYNRRVQLLERHRKSHHRTLLNQQARVAQRAERNIKNRNRAYNRRIKVLEARMQSQLNQRLNKLNRDFQRDADRRAQQAQRDADRRERMSERNEQRRDLNDDRRNTIHERAIDRLKRNDDRREAAAKRRVEMSKLQKAKARVKKAFTVPKKIRRKFTVPKKIRKRVKRAFTVPKKIRRKFTVPKKIRKRVKKAFTVPKKARKRIKKAFTVPKKIRKKLRVSKKLKRRLKPSRKLKKRLKVPKRLKRKLKVPKKLKKKLRVPKKAKRKLKKMFKIKRRKKKKRKKKWWKSDRRLKKNIKLIGQSPSGVNVYEFEYKDPELMTATAKTSEVYEEGKYRGAIADDVPERAVVLDLKTGYESIDYSKIDVPYQKLPAKRNLRKKFGIKSKDRKVIPLRKARKIRKKSRELGKKPRGLRKLKRRRRSKKRIY